MLNDRAWDLEMTGGPWAHFFVSGRGLLTERSELAATIDRMIRPSVADLGYRIVRIKFMSGKRPVLQIMAERADGTMSIEDCEILSRSISALLDVEDPIAGPFALEVSSPGIDRPLVELDDYERFRGFEARIDLKEAVEGRKRFVGRLEGIENGEIRLESRQFGSLGIGFDMIAEAKLVLTQELIDESMARTRPRPTGEIELLPEDDD